MWKVLLDGKIKRGSVGSGLPTGDDFLDRGGRVGFH
jgi:hypothetical protein